ncbi:hypothetical protein F5890DRAFT_1552671 [Lentinula detonsa]|uniref:Uncharacterized protein n=1 Tax=Lentinula detonsa TaxID=2804962 RepID=A0AA38UTI3_9AGAR|nr:hypothetical protein F5890DRAFT_1552671 [Lentinula detonsa]
MFVEYSYYCRVEEINSRPMLGCPKALLHLSDGSLFLHLSPVPGKIHRVKVQPRTSEPLIRELPEFSHHAVTRPLHPRRCNYCRSVEGRSKSSTPQSPYEPQMRTSPARACVKLRDDDRSTNSFVRYPLADENDKHRYYMQRTGPHPKESLQPKPDIVLSSWNTYLGFSFEPYGLPENSISDDDHEVWSAPYFASDPRDPTVEQSPKRTIRRHPDQAIESPTPGVISKPDWSLKPARPLGAALDFLEKLTKKLC